MHIRIEIEDDYDAMSKKAAQIFVDRVKNKPDGSYGFATGSTPIGMYQELIRMHKEEGADFSQITTFNLDEYHPISKESEHSYYHFMHEQLFNHVNLGRVFLIDGKASDPAFEAQMYEGNIYETGGIEMQILGIGVNGHIGFNEPCESFEANARCVALSDITIESNARHFASADDVPRHAITLGIRSIMLSRQVLLLANGGAKAAILRDAFYGPITPLVPASILQLHPSVIVVVDKEAAASL